MTYFAKRQRFKRISQKESQKRVSLLKVINALSKRSLCTTEIILLTDLSPKSVVGSLRILECKGVLSKKQVGHRKIYSLNVGEAREYLLNLYVRSLKKQNPQTWPIIKKAFNVILKGSANGCKKIYLIPTESILARGMGNYVPLDMLIPTVASPDFEKVFEEYDQEYFELFPHLYRVLLGDMPELFRRLRTGELCISCLKKGRNYKTLFKDKETGEFVCRNCGEVLGQSPL
jgi:hypothetical protein